MHFSHNMYSALVGVHLLHHSPHRCSAPKALQRRHDFWNAFLQLCAAQYESRRGGR